MWRRCQCENEFVVYNFYTCQKLDIPSISLILVGFMFFMLKNVAKRRFNRSFKAIAMDSEVDDLSSSMTLKAASALFHFNIDIMYNLWHGVSTIDDFLL